jgi:hypothetical protein
VFAPPPSWSSDASQILFVGARCQRRHDEVYVDSFPVAGNRRQISVGGGMHSRWRRDGSELFYLAPDQMLTAVPVTSKSGYFDAGRATPLFRIRLVPTGSQIVGIEAMYDATRDGQRFLINGPSVDPVPPVTVGGRIEVSNLDQAIHPDFRDRRLRQAHRRRR